MSTTEPPSSLHSVVVAVLAESELSDPRAVYATGGPVFAELAVFTQDQAVRKYQREARVQSLYPATCWPSREHHAAILGSGAVSVALAAASGWTPLGIAATLVVFLALASHARSLPRVQLQRKAVLRHGQRAVSEGSDGRS
jgi:hypothetical protein